jgi:hypothetical protein
MKIKNMSELFSLKGLCLSALLFGFNFLVGYLAGFALEQYYGFRGKNLTFLGQPPKTTLGLTAAFGSLIYFIWLVYQNSKKPKTDD